uniref:Uncharacterized protein n=1 Tax=Oryza glaberrima TaxID=4538 RepID=I1PZ68_ORYGL
MARSPPAASEFALRFYLFTRGGLARGWFGDRLGMPEEEQLRVVGGGGGGAEEGAEEEAAEPPRAEEGEVRPWRRAAPCAAPASPPGIAAAAVSRRGRSLRSRFRTRAPSSRRRRHLLPAHPRRFARFWRRCCTCGNC